MLKITGEGLKIIFNTPWARFDLKHLKFHCFLVAASCKSTPAARVTVYTGGEFSCICCTPGSTKKCMFGEKWKWNRISCQTPLERVNFTKACVITLLHTAGTTGVLRFIKCTSQVPRPWGTAKRFCRWGAYSTMKIKRDGCLGASQVDGSWALLYYDKQQLTFSSIIFNN